MSKSDEQLFEEFQDFKKRKDEAEKQEQPPRRKAEIRMPGDYEEHQKNGTGPKALRRFLKKQKQAERRIRNNGGPRYVSKQSNDK